MGGTLIGTPMGVAVACRLTPFGVPQGVPPNAKIKS